LGFFIPVLNWEIKLEWGFRGKSEAPIRSLAKTIVETKVRLPTHPSGAWVAAKIWSSSHKDGAKVMPQTGGFGCTKKEFAFFDVPEPEHQTKMGGINRTCSKRLTKMAVSQV